MEGTAVVSLKINPSPLEGFIFDQLKAFAEENDCAVRVAGGWVRDKLVGIRNVYDLDLIAENLRADDFANRFIRWLTVRKSELEILDCGGQGSRGISKWRKARLKSQPNRFVRLDFSAHLGGNDYESPSVRPLTTPQKDAWNRDFTVNCLFYNINTGKIEDFTGRGLKAIGDRVLETPMDALESFKKDPFRVIRLARFVGKLNFTVKDDVLEALKLLPRDSFDCIVKYKIKSELEKNLRNRKPSAMFKWLHSVNLLEAVVLPPSCPRIPYGDEDCASETVADKLTDRSTSPTSSGRPQPPMPSLAIPYHKRPCEWVSVRTGLNLLVVVEEELKRFLVKDHWYSKLGSARMHLRGIPIYGCLLVAFANLRYPQNIQYIFHERFGATYAATRVTSFMTLVSNLVQVLEQEEYNSSVDGTLLKIHAASSATKCWGLVATVVAACFVVWSRMADPYACSGLLASERQKVSDILLRAKAMALKDKHPNDEK